MRLLFGIFFLTVATLPLLAGLLVNPGFGDGENNWQKWRSGKSMELRLSERGRNNTRCAVIAGKDTEKAAWTQIIGALSPGDYVLSSWVKTSGLSGHVELQVSGRKNGKTVYSKKITAPECGDWTRVPITFHAVATADQWVLSLFIQGPGTAWFDDVELTGKVAAVFPVSLEGIWKFHPGDDPRWAATDYSDSAWSVIKVPALWEEEGYPDLEGFAWYRRTVKLPANVTGKTMLLTLGAISKADEVYFNGQLIGRTGSFQPQFKADTYALRRYLIPSALVKAGGDNILAVRVSDGFMQQSGGIWKKPCELRPALPEEYLDCRITSAVPGNIFTVGERPVLTMTWSNNGDTSLDGVNVSGAVVDYRLTTVSSFNKKLDLIPGKPCQTTISLEPVPSGLYYLNLNLTASNGVSVKKTFNFGVLAPAAAATLTQDGKFGVACHLNRIDERDLKITLDLAKRAGLSWIRTGFLWRDLEKKQGSFDWTRFDRTVAAVKKQHLGLVATLAIIPDWASSDPLGRLGKRHKSGRIPVLEAWEKYIHAMVKRYSDYCRYWEIWNEPNLVSYWKPSPDSYEYFQLLNAAYRQAKLADPQSIVLTAGLVPYLHVKEPTLAGSVFLDDLYRYAAGQPAFDRIGYHPYPRMRKGVTNHNIEQELNTMFKRLRGSAAANGDRDRRFWLTETGCADLPRTIDERRQAECLVVIMAVCAADKDVEKIFWYNFQEDGDNCDDPEHNYGLVKQDFSPKPAFFAYHTLIGKLTGAKFIGKSVDGGVTEYRFKRNGQTSIVWSDKETDWRLPEPKAKAYDLMGNLLPVVTGLIKVGPAPVYVEFSGRNQ